MVDINWNILRPVDIGGAFQQGMEQGRQRRAESEIDKQLAAMAQNPNAPISNELMKFAPREAYALQQQRAQQAKAAQQQRRVELTDMAKLFGSVTDEASYQRGLAVARNWGIDVSEAPQAYDPNWVAEQKMLTEAFIRDPEQLTALLQEAKAANLTPEQLKQAVIAKYSPVKTVPYNPGGGVAGYNVATREIIPIVVPNPGTASTGAAVNSDIPASAIEDLRAGRGSAEQFDEIFGAGAAERVLGGSVGNGAGGFR